MTPNLRRKLDLWEPHIHAFVAVQDTPPSATGFAPRENGRALADIRLGVKDIIDVAGFATRNGSRACQAARPADKDAPVVAALRAAGAQVIGKTTTTEFAFTDPTNCRNPFDIRRSPGGSSSGSGAAVAAGLLDAALGTQTAGSLCRPAAYCGAVGFKPSYGALSTVGVTPLAPSFDSVGIISASVELAQRCFAVLRPDSHNNDQKPLKDCRVVKTLLDMSVAPSPQTQAALDNASNAIAHLGANVIAKNYGVDVARIVQNHRCVMNFEAAAAHGHMLSDDRAAVLQSKFLAGLRAGAEISSHQADQAKETLAHAQHDMWQALEKVDFVLTLPVPDGAPFIDGTTGFQDWLTPWTVFGGPLICLPWGLDDLGRPLSVMLAGHPGADTKLLAMAAALAPQAPPMPRPTLPAP